MTKFIFITGGVVSSLGKGIVSSSIASLLSLSNFKEKTSLKLSEELSSDQKKTLNRIKRGEKFEI